MKQWCALLEGEMETWPQVRSRPMFGMRAFYRGRRIFACIPRTRALGAANAIILKFPRAREVLRRAGDELSALDPGALAPRWLALEINGQADLRRALAWLDRAYRNAVSAKPS